MTSLHQIRKNRFIAAVLLPFMLMSNGCIYMVVGGIGALGGYVVSPDTVEGVTPHDEIVVWRKAKEILSIMGIIVEEYEAGGTLLAEIAGTKVTVMMYGVDSSTTKVTVKARKAFLPRISTAQDVFVKIMSSLSE